MSSKIEESWAFSEFYQGILSEGAYSSGRKPRISMLYAGALCEAVSWLQYCVSVQVTASGQARL